MIEGSHELGVIAALALEPGALEGVMAFGSVMASAEGWIVGLVIGYGRLIRSGAVNALGPFVAQAGAAFAQVYARFSGA